MAKKTNVFELNPGEDKNRIPIILADYEEGDDYVAYVKLLERGAQLDNYLDFRISFLTSDFYYSPERLNAENIEEQMFTAQAKGDMRKAAEYAAELLQENYTHIIAHLVMAEYYDTINSEVLAERYASIGIKLLNTILESGDGTSPEDAYVIFGEEEEMSVLGHLGGEIMDQEIIDIESKYYSIVTLNQEDGVKKVYFDISEFFPPGQEDEELNVDDI